METSKDCKESRTNNQTQASLRAAVTRQPGSRTKPGSGDVFFSRGFLTSLLRTYPSLGVGLRGGGGGRGTPQHAVQPGDIIAFFSEL